MIKLAYLFMIPLAAATDQRPSPSVAMRTDLSIRPVRWTVVGGGSPREVVSGRTVAVTLQAEIAKGWHIYSLTQKPGGPIPLSIQLLNPADVLVRGVIKAPKPETIFDKNFGMETELYSGSPRFTIPIGVPGRTLTGTRKLQIAAHYQVCSATLCLPARTDKLDLTLRITGRK